MFFLSYGDKYHYTGSYLIQKRVDPSTNHNSTSQSLIFLCRLWVRRVGMSRHKYDFDLIKSLSDGARKSREIADIIGNGCTPKYIQNVWRRNPELKRPRQSPPSGKDNPSWKGGRTICTDGYIIVSVMNHPYMKKSQNKSSGQMYEHRLVMEKKLNRYLLPREVVDHIDGCTIHNDPKNLRLFASNSDHLRETLSGKVPHWSKKGYEKMCLSVNDRKHIPKIDTYHHRRKSGVIRLRQILLAHVLLDKDSPYLLGTQRWLDKASIDLGDFLSSKLNPDEYLQLHIGHQ